MKKLVLLTLLALSFLVARPLKHQNPIPQCDPCSWRR
jgi:hypothetical protein